MAKNANTQIDSDVSDVDQKIQDSNEWAHRRQMVINTNYYLGNQWIGWDNNAHKVMVVPRQPNEERITHNVIKPRVMTKLSKQTKNRLTYDVAPDTNDDERIEAAKGATKYVHYWWEQEEMDLKTRDIFLNNNIKGYCAVKVVLDTDQGDDITPDEDEAESLGMDKEDGKTVKTGKVTARVCDALTLYIDPAATTDSEIRWIIEEKPKDVDYIEQEYGKVVLPDENISYTQNYDANNYGSSQQVKLNQKMAMVREMWVAPCKKHPKGLKVTCTKNVLLDRDEDAGEIPYIIFGDIPIPSSVRYDAFIKDMLPIQRNLNIALSMFAINMKRMGNNMWFIPTGSGVDEEELSNEQGGFVHYNAMSGAAPSRPEAPDMPSFFDRLIEHYNTLIDDMSGAREISAQRLPQGLDTASGLSLMVEQENEKLAVPMNNYEQGMKKVLNRVLKLFKKHYTEERLGRMVGEDGQIETISFMGSDLNGGEDIRIVQGSSLPEMKSAQQDRIMSMWNAQMIVNKQGLPDAERAMRALSLGDSSVLLDQDELDEDKAKMENHFFATMPDKPDTFRLLSEYMQAKQKAEALNQEIQQHPDAQGIDTQSIMEPMPKAPKGIPLVRDFQDHVVHLYNHNNFRKCEDYDDLPDEMQALVDAHVKEHEAMMQQSQQQAQSADPNVQAMQEKTQAIQQQNDLKQQELQFNAQSTQAKTQAELQKQQMQMGTEQQKLQVGAISQAAKQQHEQQLAHLNAGRQLGSDMIKAEQSHGHQMIQGAVNHQRSLQTTHISHGQQMQRDKQNNKTKQAGKK
jgi:hypothetical protein